MQTLLDRGSCRWEQNVSEKFQSRFELQAYSSTGIKHRHQSLGQFPTRKTSNHFAAEQATSGETNRRVISDILCHTGGVADLAAEFVLVDAVGGRGLADMAGSACEHEAVVDAVFFRVKQVGTGNC